MAEVESRRSQRSRTPRTQFVPGSVCGDVTLAEVRAETVVEPEVPKNKKRKVQKTAPAKTVPAKTVPEEKKPPVETKEKDSSPKRLNRDAESWTIDEVSDWLKSTNFAKEYVDVFYQNEIDGALLSELDNGILENELHISKKFHRKRLLREIEDLIEVREPLSDEDGKSNAALETELDDESDAITDHETTDEETLNGEPEVRVQGKRKYTQNTGYESKKRVKVPMERPSFYDNHDDDQDGDDEEENATPGMMNCPGCKTQLKAGTALCMSCMWVFPETKSQMFGSATYFRRGYKRRTRDGVKI